MNENTDKEQEIDKALRPLSFSDFIGQDSIVKNLKVFVEACNQREDALDHTLFHGPPGLGKTTLAHILANELNVGLKVTSGPVIDKPGDLAGLLTKLDIKAIEAGIVLNAALEDGLVYQEQEMIIDVEKFRNDLAQAHQEAVSLSIEAAYITADNIEQILAKAAQSARSVSTEAGYLTEDTKEQVLQKAHGQAQGVASKAKDYTPA